MTFDQWWQKRVKRPDLKGVSPEGQQIYKDFMRSAWNAAMLDVAAFIDRETRAGNSAVKALMSTRIYIAP